MTDLKRKLLESNLVENSSYLDKYVEVIMRNIQTAAEKFRTQSHHIIPTSFFREYNRTHLYRSHISSLLLSFSCYR